MAAGRNERTHPTLWEIYYYKKGTEDIVNNLMQPMSLQKAVKICKIYNKEYDDCFYFPIRKH